MLCGLEYCEYINALQWLYSSSQLTLNFNTVKLYKIANNSMRILMNTTKLLDENTDGIGNYQYDRRTTN